MAKEAESTFKIGEKSLYTKTWLPDGEIKAKLVFFHGFSDHVGRYYGFFPHLASRGIAVYGLDQRGWGRSVAKPCEKGLTGPTSQVLADMVAFILPQLPAAASDPPCFVMGHSMGGGDALALACDASGAYGAQILPKVRGWLCEAPFVGFAPEEVPSWFLVQAGRVAGKLFPHAQLVRRIPPENLSRDPEVQKSIAEDKLMHNTGTLEGLAGLIDRTNALTRCETRPAPRTIKALWFGHGTDDKTTSFPASKHWFDTCTADIPDKTFKAYEGYYHQLHSDIGKEAFYADVADWILARLGPEPPATAKL